MTKLRTFVTLIMTGALVFGLAAPASAQIGTVGASCNAGSSYRLTAAADYDGTWRTLRYRLTGGGDQSNVNIRIYQSNGTLLWWWNSPDNREAGVWYEMIPYREGPGDPDPVPLGWPVPSGSGYRITFTAVFDRSVWSDPSCLGTGTIP